MEVFAQIPDPRDPRGVRHDLATVLTLAQTAVLAGARTLLAIAEWTHDAARDTLSRIGISPDQALPSESTIRRTLAQLDANDLDARLAGWMATRVGHLAGRRVIAFDGKTMRGARTPAGAPHLVAAFDHAAGAVVGQLAVSAKSNEIPALRDLLESMDITEAVVTADAMHCLRETAEHITSRGGHYVLTVKANQPTLRAACKALPWKNVPARTTSDRSHGRRVRRTIKAVQAPRLDRIPRRRPDHPTPPNPNDQGTQDDRGRLRDLLTGHDPGSTGHRRHLDPRSLGHREPALGSGRHLRRGPPPAAHRQRTTSHGHPPQHSHQPSPPGRTHQDRHRSTTSWSAHQQAYRPSSQRMKATLPRPWHSIQLAVDGYVR